MKNPNAIQKWKDQIWKKGRSHNGFSTVEMLITIMIFGFLSILSAAGIAMAYRTVEELKDQAQIQSVTTTLLDTISEELQFTAKEKIYLLGEDTDSPVIAFTNADGIPVYITSDDRGFLLIHYRSVRSEGEGEKESDWSLKSSDWTYEPGLYGGWCFIENGLTFSVKEGASDPLLIEVKMKAAKYEDGKQGDTVFERSVTIPVYNLTVSDVDGTLFRRASELMSDEEYRKKTNHK